MAAPRPAVDDLRGRGKHRSVSADGKLAETACDTPEHRERIGGCGGDHLHARAILHGDGPLASLADRFTTENLHE